MSAEAVFRAKAPELMSRLIARFDCTAQDAAAIAGNAGHESGGLATLQEIAPTVKGSRGGYGWFQWTGPRRKAFEKFCSDKGLKPSSDKANTEFLIYELITTEARAMPAVKAAKTLYDKVVAFELGFERAGVKHYDSRLRWAEIALDAYQKAQGAQPALVPPVEPPKSSEPPPAAGKPNLLTLIINLILALLGRK